MLADEDRGQNGQWVEMAQREQEGSSEADAGNSCPHRRQRAEMAKLQEPHRAELRPGGRGAAAGSDRPGTMVAWLWERSQPPTWTQLLLPRGTGPWTKLSSQKVMGREGQASPPGALQHPHPALPAAGSNGEKAAMQKWGCRAPARQGEGRRGDWRSETKAK